MTPVKRRPGWRRSVGSRSDRLPGYEVPIRTPESRDAPIDEGDNRFWWLVAVAIGLFAVVAITIAFTVS